MKNMLTSFSNRNQAKMADELCIPAEFEMSNL